MRSFSSSIPHESRMKPSVIPTLRRSSASMLACVMTDGHVMMDSTAPRFSQSDHGRCVVSMSLRPAAEPPLISHQSMPPWKPSRCCLSARAFWGNDARPGYRTRSTLGCDSRNVATAMAFAACFRQRTAMVLQDWSVKNAVCGVMMLPCMFWKKWSSSSSSLVLAVTQPPTVMLWPSKYLVVECRLRSQPSSSGRIINGVANVASQQWSTPAFLATAEMTFRSVSVSVGFAGVSEKMSFVAPGRIAASTALASVKSTKLNSMPKRMKSLRAARFVPP
mmetsp:Transcript_7108/g.22443  ORF Transcript_7108/g.22443 Transcript_7108/m.22443 type:complete len:277 (+) Transcript_7108:171-1001(+)